LSHKARLRQRYPSIDDLRQRARWRVPRFGFDFVDGGANDEVCIARNIAAFRAVELLPRYCVDGKNVSTEVELFGRRYAAPIGIAPMGGPSLVWPGADLLMAKAAQAARVPYTLGVAGGATIEDIAKVAPDVFWLQLYRFSPDDHKIGFDLIARAQAANVKALTLTLDVPVRTTRSRETYAGLAGEFRPNLRMIYEMLIRPKWLMALLRNGYPRFATIRHYAGERASTNDVIRFARSKMGGAFSWDEVARYRDKWQGPLLLKGILHPQDAEKAVALGCEGIWVSNHGGRQIEALAPSIDCLPGIVSAVGKKATIVLDSGIRSGQDVMRTLALGADAAFAGKSFLWAVAALGDAGPAHLIDLYIDELRSSLGQIGARSPAEARAATVLHSGAIKF
jgi:L-lactate dehydrogenase (cytochrome)